MPVSHVLRGIILSNPDICDLYMYVVHCGIPEIENEVNRLVKIYDEALKEEEENPTTRSPTPEADFKSMMMGDVMELDHFIFDLTWRFQDLATKCAFSRITRDELLAMLNLISKMNRSNHVEFPICKGYNNDLIRVANEWNEQHPDEPPIFLPYYDTTP